MKLTDTFAKRKQANGKVQKHSDGGGLYLYITPEGKKSWRLGYRFLGKQKLLVIGPYPAISLKEARERREAAKKLLIDNIDPSTAKQEAKAAASLAVQNSFEAVAREWIEKKGNAWAEESRYQLIKRLEKDIFPALGKRPIKSINAPELLSVLRRVENRSIDTANRAMGDCSRIFRYAIVTGRAERDVAADLRGALATQPIKHFATIRDKKEIGILLNAFDTYHGNVTTKCGLRLAPFVFVRPTELSWAEWSEIDFDAAEWRISAGRMKMRQDHIVPLSRQSLEILRELHSFTGNSKYLFPSMRTNNEIQHRTTFVHALRRMGYTADIMTMHGFRSMASTILNELGYNRDWIERQLAHTERNSIRAAYNYAEYLPERRKMMQDWADLLTDLKEKARKEMPTPSTATA